MALVMYLTRVPSYENTTVEEIKLIELYLSWQHQKKIGSKYASDTFEKWCSHSESELPNKEVIDYYRPFWTTKHMYMEMVGNVEGRSIFDQLARFVKSNPIFNWFYDNVLDHKLDKGYHKVTREQLEKILNICIKVKNDGIVLIKKNKHGIDELNEYRVDENIAKDLLPTYNNAKGYFGPDKYENFYAYQVINAIDIVNNILKTTDFESQTIYLNFTSV